MMVSEKLPGGFLITESFIPGKVVVELFFLFVSVQETICVMNSRKSMLRSMFPVCVMLLFIYPMSLFIIYKTIVFLNFMKTGKQKLIMKCSCVNENPGFLINPGFIKTASSSRWLVIPQAGNIKPDQEPSSFYFCAVYICVIKWTILVKQIIFLLVQQEIIPQKQLKRVAACIELNTER